MDITLNGKKVEVSEGTSILILLSQKGLEPERVVVEYNYDIVKKENLGSIFLKENDNIEVLRFVGGG